MTLWEKRDLPVLRALATSENEDLRRAAGYARSVTASSLRSFAISALVQLTKAHLGIARRPDARREDLHREGRGGGRGQAVQAASAPAAIIVRAQGRPLRSPGAM